MASFFFFIAFAQLQGNGIILFKDSLNWNAGIIGIYFLLVGAIDIVIQGFLAEKLIEKFGESNLIKTGLYMCSVAFISYSLLPVTHNIVFAVIGAGLFATGSGLFEPSMASTVSKTSTGSDQGLVQGAYQSLQSLTRVIGPLLATLVYGFGASNPYILSAAFCMLSVLLFIRLNK